MSATATELSRTPAIEELERAWDSRDGDAPVILTPDQRVRVFISSTLAELAAERAAARRAIRRLHLAPVWYESGARHGVLPGLQALLGRLGVFAGGCTLQAAEAVCRGDGIDPGTVFELLASLVARSLVVAEEHGPDTRSRLLETIRQYGQERLEGAGEAERWRARHARFHAELLQRVRHCAHDPRAEVFWAVDLAVDQWSGSGPCTRTCVPRPWSIGCARLAPESGAVRLVREKVVRDLCSRPPASSGTTVSTMRSAMARVSVARPDAL